MSKNIKSDDLLCNKKIINKNNTITFKNGINNPFCSFKYNEKHQQYAVYTNEYKDIDVHKIPNHIIKNKSSTQYFVCNFDKKNLYEKQLNPFNEEQFCDGIPSLCLKDLDTPLKPGEYTELTWENLFYFKIYYCDENTSLLKEINLDLMKLFVKNKYKPFMLNKNNVVETKLSCFIDKNKPFELTFYNLHNVNILNKN